MISGHGVWVFMYGHDMGLGRASLPRNAYRVAYSEPGEGWVEVESWRASDLGCSAGLEVGARVRCRRSSS